MAAKKPNILLIMGDDIGWFNISAYDLVAFLPLNGVQPPSGHVMTSVSAR